MSILCTSVHCTYTVVHCYYTQYSIFLVIELNILFNMFSNYNNVEVDNYVSQLYT